MQEVSKEEILHIANLARLNLEEDEIEKYREKFTRYIKFCKRCK